MYKYAFYRALFHHFGGGYSLPQPLPPAYALVAIVAITATWRAKTNTVGIVVQTSVVTVPDRYNDRYNDYYKAYAIASRHLVGIVQS